MRAIAAGMLANGALVLALAGCGNPQTSGIVAIGPDTYAVETRGRSLAPAVERGLTEATSFCAAQSRQTELLGTRINADNYQVAFRCTGGTGFAGNPGVLGRVPAGYATRQSSLGPIPVTSGRPVISGQAFPPPAPPPAGYELGTVGALPGRTATVAGNPFAQAAPLPQAPVRQPNYLPPVSSLSSPAGPLAFQAPLTAAPMTAAPMAAAPPVSPSAFAPLQSPLAAPAPGFALPRAPAAASVFAPPAAPAFAPPAATAFAPLQSPLAAPAPAPAFAAPAAAPAFAPLASPLSGSPAPAGPPVFQPLSTPAAAPPSGFQPLPGAARPLSALPPVAAPTRGGTSVPAVSSGAPLGDSSGVVPPPAFWSTPR